MKLHYLPPVKFEEKFAALGVTQGNLGLIPLPHSLDQHQIQKEETLD